MSKFVPNQSEVGVIAQLRDKLSDLSDWSDLQLDPFLLRWLQVCEMKVDATATALLESYHWRKTNGIDTILTDYTPPPQLSENFEPYKIVGFDKQGCPMVMHDVRPNNPKQLIKEFGKEALVQYENFQVEQMVKLCRERQTPDRPIQQIIVLCDAKKLTMKQLTSPGATELAIEQVKILEKNYPNTLKLMVVVNAPKTAKIAYKIIKPFVREQTLKRVKVYSKCGPKVRNLLLEYADESEIPRKYGGTKIVDDEENEVFDGCEEDEEVMELESKKENVSS